MKGGVGIIHLLLPQAHTVVAAYERARVSNLSIGGQFLVAYVSSQQSAEIS